MFVPQAIDRALSCIDHADCQYRHQQILVEFDCVFHTMELLKDEDSEAVQVKAASLVAAMTDHCAGTKVRLQSGVTDLSSQVPLLLLNTSVQDAFLESGAVDALVPWLFDERDIKSSTAYDALMHLTSLNKDGKIMFLQAVCASFGHHAIDALDIIETVISGLHTINNEIIDMVQPVFDDVMRLLGDWSIHAPTQVCKCLSFVSSICERFPRLRKEAVESDGIVTILMYINIENLEVKDAAVNAVWQMCDDGSQWHHITAAMCDTQGHDKLQLDRLEHSLSLLIQAGDQYDSDGGDTDDGKPPVVYGDEARKLLETVKHKLLETSAGGGVDGEDGLRDSHQSCRIM